MAIEAEADALLPDSDKLSAKAFFDLTSFAHSGLFDYCQYVWEAVSYTHLRAHETVLDLVCRLLLEKKNKI